MEYPLNIDLFLFLLLRVIRYISHFCRPFRRRCLLRDVGQIIRIKQSASCPYSVTYHTRQSRGTRFTYIPKEEERAFVIYSTVVSSHCIYTLCTPRLFYVSLYSLGSGGNFVFTVASGPSKSPSQLGNSHLNAISEGVQKETNKHARANAYGSRHLYVTVSSRFKCLFCLTRDAKPNKKATLIES